MQRQVNEPKLIATLQNNLEIWLTDIEHIREQDRNAQYQPPEMLVSLSENIKKEKRLESMPFVIRHIQEDKVRFEMVSGHHRVRAARMACVFEIYVLAEVRELTRSSIVAKQIAHNAISGKSDEQVLREMYKEIQDVADKYEAYINPADINIMYPTESPKPEQIAVDFLWRATSFFFLDAQFKNFEELFNLITGEEESINICPREQFEALQEALKRSEKSNNVRSAGTVMSKIIDLARKEYGLKTDENENTVSLVDVLGSAKIGVDLADKINKIFKAKEIKPKNGTDDALRALVDMIGVK